MKEEGVRERKEIVVRGVMRETNGKDKNLLL